MLGEDVAAVVVARPGVALDPDELKAWTKERVAAYKYPRQIVLVDELPKSPTGKILKRGIDLGTLFEEVGAAHDGRRLRHPARQAGAGTR